MTEPMHDDDGGRYISAGAAHRFRRLWILLVFFVLVLGFVAFAALDARDSSKEALDTVRQEVGERVAANARAIKIGCEKTNTLATRLKDIIASQGTTTPPVDVASLGFADPAVSRFVQGIIDRSQANAARLRAQGTAIRILDCAKLAATGRQ